MILSFCDNQFFPKSVEYKGWLFPLVDCWLGLRDWSKNIFERPLELRILFLNALIARKYIGVKWIWRLSYLKSPRRNSFNTKAHHSHPLLSIKPWKPCFCNVAWSTGVEYVLLLLKNYCYCPFLELLLLLLLLTRSFPELLLLLLLSALPKLLLLLLIDNFSIDQLWYGQNANFLQLRNFFHSRSKTWSSNCSGN